MSDIQTEIEKHLEKFPVAKNFLVAYAMLCHAVDDLIDQDNPAHENYTNLALDCMNLALDVYSNRFYHENIVWLYPLLKNKHRVYSASLAWEDSDVAWKAQYADVLRCGGDEMTLAILDHVCHLPYAELRRIDAIFREYTWHRHHTPEGKPI